MNLSDFERHIDYKILQRGGEYYRSGAIQSITEKGDNTYIAVVEGTEDYSVTVLLLLFEILECRHTL